MFPLRLLQSLHSPLCVCSKPSLTLWPAATRLIFGHLQDDMINMRSDLERTMQRVHQAYPLVDMEIIRRSVQSRRPANGDAPSVRKEGKENYELTLDISAFSPEDLIVKTEGRRLIVSGKHDKKEEHENGSYFHEYREWKSETELPKDVNPEDVVCSLSKDRQLHFQAPRRALPPASDRSIPINVIQNPVEGQQKLPEIKNGQPNEKQEQGPSCS